MGFSFFEVINDRLTAAIQNEGFRKIDFRQQRLGQFNTSDGP